MRAVETTPAASLNAGEELSPILVGRAQWKINQPPPLKITSELGGGMRGQARGSPVLVQRAVSEDPRWTRAVGDPLARPQGRGEDTRSEGQLGRSRVSVKGKVKQ
jgi:hypothetical protein